ncbi:MAG: hypothetical protein GOV00_01470 [Candidatus Altiarchaeota archaeon]|nr:hypothetical protein [Candidatus Altiarchaeota archaeon]
MKISGAQKLLKKYGVNIIGSVASLEAVLAMKRPLVLKADTDEHKTDKGLVFVDLHTDEEIKNAFKKISKVADVFAQPLIRGEEMIVGVVEDPTFGKMLMFGAGGILTEIYKDTSFRLPHLDKKEVNAMIADTEISKVLEGFRGKKVNKSALIDLILAVSKFAIKESDHFKELDLNPVIVNQEGVFVVDVRLLI